MNGHKAGTVPPGTQTLARGLAVLRAVAGGAHSLNDVVESSGVGRSTAHRLLQLLEQEGYVERRTAGYVLGPALIEYGFLALSNNPVPVVARPVLEDLASTYQDTVHLGIVDDGQVLYLDKIAGSRGPVANSRIGHRMPLTRTGIGKALILDRTEHWESLYRADHEGEDGLESGLADFIRRMEAYRESGTAMDLEENEQWIRCVAAPVRNGGGRIVAAVSISATRPYFPPARMRALVPVMRDAAHAISRKLGQPQRGSEVAHPRR